MPVQRRRLTNLALAGTLVASGLLITAQAALAGGTQQPTPGWQDVSPTPFADPNVIAAGLNGVSCASPQSCLAVGSFETNSSSFESFSQSWNGTSWNPQIMPKPTSTNLDGVSCPAANACEAVGEIARGVKHAPMAERWNGAGWTLQNPPAPAGTTSGFLLSVSCPAKTSCMAVGSVTRSGKEAALAERWTGKKWQVTPTPTLAGKKNVKLDSVSCPAASSCVAIGDFLGGTFAEVWNGTTWQVTSAVPDPKGSTHSALRSVSCPSAKDCVAVGSGVRGSKDVPLAERWNGKKWSPLPAVAPAGTHLSGLSSVSCTSASACGAVGFANFSSTTAIAESWTGKQWVVHPVVLPTGSQGTILGSVSCNSAVACMAAGAFFDAASEQKMLAERYS